LIGFKAFLKYSCECYISSSFFLTLDIFYDLVYFFSLVTDKNPDKKSPVFELLEIFFYPRPMPISYPNSAKKS